MVVSQESEDKPNLSLSVVTAGRRRMTPNFTMRLVVHYQPCEQLEEEQQCYGLVRARFPNVAVAIDYV